MSSACSSIISINSTLVNLTDSVENEHEIIKKMTRTLEKRGPDDENIWLQRHVAFGHRRLAVVDLEGGKQPMTRGEVGNRFTITYNGELYNTEDIRKELLARGHTFSAHSDTEVLLKAYMEWEEECVHHLNGIFAFAIWDEKKEKLFMARDRLGVKPLFFKKDGGTLYFGSELKAILAHPKVKAELDYTGLAEILGLGPSRTPGNGVFIGVEELRPAHGLSFSKEGFHVWRYWNVESKPHLDSFEETVEKVRFLLSDAITRQLVSDVPLSTFLSGGLDSSAITAFAAEAFKKEGKGTLHTYSIDYEENDRYFTKSDFQPNADSKWIQMMTDTFQTEHHYCEIDNQTLFEYLEEATLAKDLPGMADIDSSLLWFCQQVKQGFVVSLSGECADEFFGDYPWFYREADLHSPNFPWMRSVHLREALLKDTWRDKLNIKQYVQDRYQETVAETPTLAGENPLEEKRRQLFYLNMLWFMTTLLDRKDRMSMRTGLEVRVPFADHRLVEYVWNIPWEMKNYQGREKGLLRQVLKGTLPEEVLYRKKSPYPKTHHPLYIKAVVDWLERILQNKSSILYELFRKEQLASMIESEGKAFTIPWFGQLMMGPQLLAYLAQIHIWFETHRIDIKE